MGLFVFFGKECSEFKLKKANPILILNKVNDSLLSKAYDELEALAFEYKRDTTVRIKYANAYLTKGKKENDTLRIANGYRLICKLNLNDAKIVSCYADSIIEITKNKNYKKYPTRGYLFKGISFISQNQYEKALDPFLKGLQYARFKNDDHNIIALKNNIALLKGLLGNNEEALKEYLENFEFIKKQDTINKFRPNYLAAISKIAELYNYLDKVDSASYFINKGFSLSVYKQDSLFYPNLLRSYGINSYKRKKYNIAIDSLNKALTISSDNSIIYHYLAKSFLKTNQQDTALVYFKKYDSITSINNYLPETRGAIIWLINYHRNQNDKKNQLRLLEKLIQLDSITYKRHSELSINLANNYNTANLIREKENLITEIEKKSKNKYSYTVIIGITCLLILTFFYYKLQKRNKIKYKEKIQEIRKEKPNKIIKKDIELSNDLIQEILIKIKKFENNQEFLKNDITLAKVAKKFKTNSTYLSKIINTYKGKNFANYLNDLRIDFCIEKLKNDNKFRNYSLQSIAKDIGFNSIQSFSSAFYKKTGKQPSFYVKELLSDS
ncbi:helix-turn-helix domain-containing protein [Aquimarina aggregata]|uniref:helix-turn-helix domain-containing protein n=1 Tax=Aquimarina aggregata TaxID=1642818 RepID=UPI0024923EA4|nr:helix-turn-helix domain-containing protein [Aquimarina aggregata]